MSSLVCNSSSESSDTDSDGSTEPTDFSQFSAETLAALQWVGLLYSFSYP